jgi:hypothetical protein
VSESSPERPEGESRPRAVGVIPRALAEASPTWELELLISGAVLIALFQLAGVVDRGYDRYEPHLGRAAAASLFFAYWYGKAMVLALIGTFVLHLASRGYWVGLVGLNSVFPRGVRWGELKYGPTMQDVMRERLPSLPPIIGRLDNFCSVIFSLGFLLVLFFGFSMVLVALVGGLAYGIALVAFGGRRLLGTFYALLAVMLVPSLVASVLDRMFGARLDSNSRGARTIRLLSVVQYWSAGLPIIGPIYLALISNTRRRLFATVFYVVIFGILAFVGARMIARRGGLEVNRYAYFAQPDRFSVNPSYYESQRPADDPWPLTPTIQSDVIREPFVKLFIPYSVRRHNRAIAVACPGVRPLRPLGLELAPGRDDDLLPDSAATAVLTCLVRVHRVTLNGAAVTDLAFHFYTHPSNSLRGVVAYIATAGLPRGRNVLTVQPAPRPPSMIGRHSTRPLTPYVIPFWL